MTLSAEVGTGRKMKEKTKEGNEKKKGEGSHFSELKFPLQLGPFLGGKGGKSEKRKV